MPQQQQQQQQQQQRRRRHDNNRHKPEENPSLILDLARVTRVQRGGKRLRFRACVALGDKKGNVGVGIAKGADVAIAVEKATRRAKRDSINVPLTKNKTIPHPIVAKYKASHIIFKPAPVGTGVRAGGVVRILCDLVGIENITAKILGTNNKVANAQAVIQGLQNFQKKVTVNHPTGGHPKGEKAPRPEEKHPEPAKK